MLTALLSRGYVTELDLVLVQVSKGALNLVLPVLGTLEVGGQDGHLPTHIQG